MPLGIFRVIRVLALAVIVALGSTATSHAEPIKQLSMADSLYDLINAVSALRASYGLPAYNINSILKYTEQAQADFMAASGNVTHACPGGIGLTDRLLAAGFSRGWEIRRNKALQTAEEHHNKLITILSYTDTAH